MNHVVMIGRLTRDPEIRTKDKMIIARYSLAVDRRGRDNAADFFNCVAFGKAGEFAEKYLKKGMKIAIAGRLQTGSYTNKSGVKINTVDIVVEGHEFCESKQATGGREQDHGQDPDEMDGFLNIPNNIDAELPFE